MQRMTILRFETLDEAENHASNLQRACPELRRLCDMKDAPTELFVIGDSEIDAAIDAPSSCSYDSFPMEEASYVLPSGKRYPTYQVRIYETKAPQYAERYSKVYWRRHLESLPKFDIAVEGVWLERDTTGPTRVIGLVGYESPEDVPIANKRYMHSTALLKDMIGFDPVHMASIRDFTVYEI